MIDIGFVSKEDWALIGGWHAGPAALTRHERQIVLVGRLQREMNARRPETSVMADGRWGPASDALYLDLMRAGHSFDLFTVPAVVDAILTWRARS